MREPFKRAAKVTLSIRKADKAALREALVSAIKPMVDYFAAELTALAMRRLDEELERIGQAVHVAVSAFATELEAPQQLPVKGQTSDIPARAGGAESKSASTTTPVSEADDSPRGAPRASGNGGFVRGGRRASPLPAVPEPAVAAEQGSTSSSPARARCMCHCSACIVGRCSDCKAAVPWCATPGLIEHALGPDIARALGEPVAADRDVKPDNEPPPAAKPKNGVRRCSRCGTVGHYASSCKRDLPPPAAAFDRTPVRIEVPPPPVRKLTAKPEALEARKAQIAARASAQPVADQDERQRPDRIRNPDRPVVHRDDEPGDPNPNADEIWTDAERDEEKAAAEARKLTGELPEHASTPSRRDASIASSTLGGSKETVHASHVFRGDCSRCGAVRVDGQLGLEPTPAEYVANMVAVFREVRRALCDKGTLWLNLGDSYASIAGGYDATGSRGSTATISAATQAAVLKGQRRRPPSGLKPKDLMGIPWRVAFALQADGWYLRSDIIWHKPNPMPESVRDRPTKSHEYVFLLSKSEYYFYDKDAASEPSIWAGQNRTSRAPARTGKRNLRTVWTIAPKPYKGAHFATMPPDLAERCIRIGSRPGDAVLDPFFGSGTVGMVAEQHGRRWIGFDINPAYEALQRERVARGRAA